MSSPAMAARRVERLEERTAAVRVWEAKVTEEQGQVKA
jgi:hypothetical protein